MALSLSNLTAVAKNKTRKRVGRGNASGHGTYSTRGLKGQKSRSGVSGLKKLGMKKQLLAIPKKRGFTSYHAKAQVVTLAELNKYFKDGAKIDRRALLRLELIRSAAQPVKVLAQGELKLKNLKLDGLTTSQSVRDQIAKAGGTIV